MMLFRAVKIKHTKFVIIIVELGNSELCGS